MGPTRTSPRGRRSTVLPQLQRSLCSVRRLHAEVHGTIQDEAGQVCQQQHNRNRVQSALILRNCRHNTVLSHNIQRVPHIQAARAATSPITSPQGADPRRTCQTASAQCDGPRVDQPNSICKNRTYTQTQQHMVPVQARHEKFRTPMCAQNMGRQRLLRITARASQPDSKRS